MTLKHLKSTLKKKKFYFKNQYKKANPRNPILKYERS